MIGIKNPKYGEVVGVFLRSHSQPAYLARNANSDLNDPIANKTRRPDWKEINEWVRKSLGSHKAPRYVFWIGDEGVPAELPKTGSGKIMKHVLREIGERLVKEGKGEPEPGREQSDDRVKARL